MLLGKKILLGVCGSIAAYKSALIVRLLKRNGAEVKVIMTSSAAAFITPLTLSTLSDQAVYQNFTTTDTGAWNNHVELGLWADHFLIAPASAHTIGKMANGICDNLLCAVYLSARCPVSIAPAMDLDMYRHPTVQKNMNMLAAYGNHIIEPGTGELASGLFGKGRMAEPEEIIAFLENKLKASLPFLGKKMLITAGPTYEPLDPVRYIGNRSSGKMGYHLAEKAKDMGAMVTLVTGPSHLPIPGKVDRTIKVNTARQMLQAVSENFDDADIIIFAAAVADYTPKEVHAEKIKKADREMNLELVKTVDIAAEMGKRKKEGQYLVGFALETENEIENAKKKLKTKNFDMVILNSTKDAGATFGYDTNKITIIDRGESIVHFDLKNKGEVASDILNTLLTIIHV
jgi:phosphopantothenoylcysteine decarboxylase/phosphopantothenate--cysteine ligase